MQLAFSARALLAYAASQAPEAAKMVAGEFCEVEKHQLPDGGAVERERERELTIAAGRASRRRALRRRPSSRRAVVAADRSGANCADAKRREHPKKRRPGVHSNRFELIFSK